MGRYVLLASWRWRRECEFGSTLSALTLLSTTNRRWGWTAGSVDDGASTEHFISGRSCLDLFKGAIEVEPDRMSEGHLGEARFGLNATTMVL